MGYKQPKKIKSICEEPILEELEEYYQYPEIDQHNHTFLIPSRSMRSIGRMDSNEGIHSQDGLLSNNNLPPISEQRDEPEDEF